VCHRRSKRGNQKVTEANENENTNYYNLGVTVKVVQRGKFIGMSAYIKNTERSKINDLMLHLILLERQEQTKSKMSRRREIIKIRGEINDIETKTAIETINEIKSSFFEKNKQNSQAPGKFD
jgi:hypothetical protein